MAAPVPSTLMSPNTSTTPPDMNSSMASSPLMLAAPLVYCGAKPKKVEKPVASEAT